MPGILFFIFASCHPLSLIYGGGGGGEDAYQMAAADCEIILHGLFSRKDRARVGCQI